MSRLSAMVRLSLWLPDMIAFRYPFSEDTSNSSTYMHTRCPSWCDRVLLSQHCWDWLHSQVGVLLIDIREFQYHFQSWFLRLVVAKFNTLILSMDNGFGSISYVRDDAVSSRKSSEKCLAESGFR